MVPAVLQDGEAIEKVKLPCSEGLLDVSSAVPETKMDKVVFSCIKLEVLLSELL